MELKHLIVRYRYLKFFVEAFEQSIIADDSAETAQQELYLKYKQAKTYLSFIETAITMLPINKRSNYNNQYEFVFRKVYIEGVKIKKIEELLNTSNRNAYEIRNRALNMIEERVDLMFDYRFQIISLDAPQKYPVIRPFSYCGQSVLDAYFDLIVKKTNSELGVIEGKLAYAVLHYMNRRMISRYITGNYKSMKRSSYLSYYQKVTDYIGVCLYGFDYLSAKKGYLITEKEAKGDKN